MNPAVAGLGASLIRELNARKKPTSIDLGLGEPTAAPNLAHFESATRWVAEHGCRYSPANAGDAQLRAAIAGHYGYPALNAARNVCVTTGSQEALYVVVKTLFDPSKEELLLVEPSFSAYAKIAQIEGLPVRRVAMRAQTGFAFEADRILQGVSPRTRAILICSPCNPTGRAISRADVQKIARALGELPGPPVYVIQDEIYREVRYTDDIGSFGDYYPYTIAINSLSKSNALTGLRLGWFAAPDEAVGNLVKVHALMTSCASTFGQRVAYELFAADELGALGEWYAGQRAAALTAARKAGLEVLEPDGAFYLCVDVKAADDTAFAWELLEKHDVVAVPAGIFGDGLSGWLRTSFVGKVEDLQLGYERIAALAREGVGTFGSSNSNFASAYDASEL
jgi:aspartate/methionine/tyrosine aminotransferase